MKNRIVFLTAICVLCAVFCIGAFAATDTVYLNDGANGTGRSADSPLGSLEEAYYMLGDADGTIKIVKTYTMQEPFYAPAHTGNITITGGSFIMNHSAYNRFYSAGPLTFKDIKFEFGPENTHKNAILSAGFQPLVIDSGVSVASSFNIYVLGGYILPRSSKEYMHVSDGNASVTIRSGTWYQVTGFSRGSGSGDYYGTADITVEGGTVATLFGGCNSDYPSESTNIAVKGGTVKTLNVAGDKERYIRGDATVTVSGGTVNSLNVNNVMGHATVNYLGGTVGMITRSTPESLQGLVTDGKADLIVRRGQQVHDFKALFDTATYEDGSVISNAQDVEVSSYTLLDKKPEKSTVHTAKVYVSNKGSGSGLSPDSPTSDLTRAYEMLRGIDGTIVLVNRLEMSGSFTEPKHDSHVVITSYDGERYFDGGFVFPKGKRFYLNGNTTFENTAFDFTGTFMMVGGFNSFTLGSGLSTPTAENGSFYVLGGYQLGDIEQEVPYTRENTVTVESGNYYVVIGHTRGKESDGFVHRYKGTQTLNLLGGSIRRVYGGSVDQDVGNNVVIRVDGASITEFIQVGGAQCVSSNKATVHIKSGSVKQLDMRNVLQSTVVNWTGGTVGEIVCKNCEYGGKVDAAKLADANGYKDATYTLNYQGVQPTDAMRALFTTVNDSVGTTVKLTIGSTTAYVNGEAHTLDAAPINRKNRTMLPVRFLANAFGIDNDGIHWDGATRTATLSNSEVTIVVTINAPSMTVNGVSVPLDSPAIIEKDRTYLPVRAIANALGVSNEHIHWDAATNTATLVK